MDRQVQLRYKSKAYPIFYTFLAYYRLLCIPYHHKWDSALTHKGPGVWHQHRSSFFQTSDKLLVSHHQGHMLFHHRGDSTSAHKDSEVVFHHIRSCFLHPTCKHPLFHHQVRILCHHSWDSDRRHMDLGQGRLLSDRCNSPRRLGICQPRHQARCILLLYIQGFHLLHKGPVV